MGACSGPDHVTDPLVAEGGAYFAALGGASNGTSASAGGSVGAGSSAAGGSTATGGNGSGGADTSGGATSASAGGGSSADFSWANDDYDPSAGTNVGFQGHFTGMACLAACHTHTMTFGGTAYAASGSSPAANAELGLFIDGRLVTTYSGSQGNFFGTISGSVDWTKAQIAIRTNAGTRTMAVNANTTGNCNGCHDSSNRIVVP